MAGGARCLLAATVLYGTSAVPGLCFSVRITESATLVGLSAATLPKLALGREGLTHPICMLMHSR